ncbi:MAG: radical SAM protein [Patescibacteria group bacterium]|nr:radical SAM protein [Patescibacteria group bacterium]MDD5490643.1 radical SAM protein [Patescibacteria group bacterium]
MKIDLQELKQRAELAKKHLSACDLCPRKCGVNRWAGETGFCRAGAEMEIAYIGLHRGEEPPLSGSRGSGAIFFSHCNLRCPYCQNWQISHKDQAETGDKEFMSAKDLAEKILLLQKQGAHNINFVSPAHYIPQILESLVCAVECGFNLPIVYNTNGYDNLDSLKLLAGVVDIYLPDIKYSDNAVAGKYSRAYNYVEANRAAITEMYRQVGDLKLDKNGIAKKGLIVRHLVLPEDLAGSSASLNFLAGLSPQIYLSLMAQYSPCHRAGEYPELNRRINSAEYEKVKNETEQLGFKNGWAQDLESSEVFKPDFTKSEPFK